MGGTKRSNRAQVASAASSELPSDDSDADDEMALRAEISKAKGLVKRAAGRAGISSAGEESGIGGAADDDDSDDDDMLKREIDAAKALTTRVKSGVKTAAKGSDAKRRSEVRARAARKHEPIARTKRSKKRGTNKKATQSRG